jgi:[protein-PII] uridylyltransferase
LDAIAISRSLLDETQDQNDLIRLSRHYIHKARQLLFARHRAGAGGAEIVAAYTTIMDCLIHHLFAVVSEDFIRRFPTQNQQCAVIAQGGYGRGELNPQSDLDLSFLYSWKISPYVESVTEKLLYTLWDAGLRVGSAVRTVSESLRLAESDIKVKTTILDSRFLCGDYALYGEFDKAVEKRLIKKRVQRFIEEKLEESRARHASYGGSVYLLEPEVKEGEGGLRDIHTARWIARVCLNAKDLDALALEGVLSADEVAALKESQDFLFRVRNELHFSTGKHQDQLTFEEQEKVSEALGFEGEGTLKGVEVFMRSYYLHASGISRLTSLVTHRLTDGNRRFFNGRGVFAKTVREGVRISQGELTITKPEILKAERGNLIRVFADAQKHRCDLSHEARSLVRAHLSLIDDTLRRSADANIPFFEILKWKERVYETLYDMHRSGVLGAFIPEFGRLLCMVLHMSLIQISEHTRPY